MRVEHVGSGRHEEEAGSGFEESREALEQERRKMSETLFVADTHLDHPNIIIHCNRWVLKPGDLNADGKWVSEEVKEARTQEMNEGVVKSWNDVASPKDTVYIVGDFAWKNHRKWLNELNGKKVFLVGSHDDMPQDTLDMFKPEDEWAKSEHAQSQAEAMKTLLQFREVHDSLVRRICGQWMHLYHWPLATWQGRPRGSWAVTGHTHGRYRKAQPGQADGGLILDVGWDVFKRPLRFEEMRDEMQKKVELGALRYRSRDEIDKE